MKERLEKFIVTNRHAFDDETPSPLIWEKVNESLAMSKKSGGTLHFLSKRMWAAAIIVSIVGTTLFLWMENYKLKRDLTASKQNLERQQEQQQESYTIDYNKEINQFTQIVLKKQSQLSVIRKEYPSLYQSFTADINDLNKEYRKLKQELVTVPEPDEILDAMILNLKLQAELLNEQLLIIQQLKSSKKHKNEKATPVI